MPNIQLIERLQAHYMAHPPVDSHGYFDWSSGVCVFGVLREWGYANPIERMDESVAHALGISEHLAWAIVYSPYDTSHVLALLADAKRAPMYSTNADLT